MKKLYIIIIALLFIPTLNSCTSQQKGFNYSAHAKKNKKRAVKYRGDLTKFKCNKTRR